MIFHQHLQLAASTHWFFARWRSTALEGMDADSAQVCLYFLLREENLMIYPPPPLPLSDSLLAIPSTCPSASGHYCPFLPHARTTPAPHNMQHCWHAQRLPEPVQQLHARSVANTSLWLACRPCRHRSRSCCSALATISLFLYRYVALKWCCSRMC